LIERHVGRPRIDIIASPVVPRRTSPAPNPVLPRTVEAAFHTRRATAIRGLAVPRGIDELGCIEAEDVGA
jgi:hypothetical protein